MKLLRKLLRVHLHTLGSRHDDRRRQWNVTVPAPRAAADQPQVAA